MPCPIPAGDRPDGSFDVVRLHPALGGVAADPVGKVCAAKNYGNDASTGLLGAGETLIDELDPPARTSRFRIPLLRPPDTPEGVAVACLRLADGRVACVAGTLLVSSWWAGAR
jgi:hypothetical protein